MSKENLRDLIIDILVIAAMIVVLTCIFKPIIVKEMSMQPNYYENDYLFINKLAYTGDRAPEYGDVIVFESELDKQKSLFGGKTMLIKRVIAVEGDTITIGDDGYVYRNGKKLKENYTKETGVTTRGDRDLTDYTVPEGKVICMGDNREVSIDSRDKEVGDVSEDDIVGKAVFRLLPLSKCGLL